MSLFPKSLLKAARNGELHPILEEAIAATAVASLELMPVLHPEDESNGVIPGIASCTGFEETYWQFVSARDSGHSMPELQALLALDAEADEIDGTAYALDEELDESAQGLPFYSSASINPYAIDYGAICDSDVAVYDTVILSEDEEVAGRLAFSLHLLEGGRDLEADDPVFEATFVELQVVLHDLRILREFRSQGASHAAMEYVAYVVYEQMEVMARQLRKPARALGTAFSLLVNVVGPARSQMDLVVGERLADHVLAHVETMLDAECLVSEKHDEVVGEVLELAEVSYSVAIPTDEA